MDDLSDNWEDYNYAHEEEYLDDFPAYLPDQNEDWDCPYFKVDCNTFNYQSSRDTYIETGMHQMDFDDDYQNQPEDQPFYNEYVDEDEDYPTLVTDSEDEPDYGIVMKTNIGSMIIVLKMMKQEWETILPADDCYPEPFSDPDYLPYNYDESMDNNYGDYFGHSDEEPTIDDFHE